MEKEAIQTNFNQIRLAFKWFCCGVRWLSIILFGCLFFLGLYFRLPWKPLVCLAVIPVVGLFVPRKIQLWIWLTLTLLLVSVFGWLFLPEQNSSRWRPYQFSRDLNVLENKLAVDGTNAADLYEQVFNEYGETIFYFRFSDDRQEQHTLQNPWNPAEHPRLDFWITALEPAMQKLIEASALEQCCFDIPHTIPSLNPQLGRLNQLKGWARLLLRASGRDLYNKRYEEAVQKQLALIGMARHLYQQKTLFDQSAAIQVETWAVRALESAIVLHLPDPQMLERAEQAMLAINPQWPRNWPDILEREKLQTKNVLGSFYEKDESGRVRISHSAMMTLQEALGYKPRRLFMNQHLMNRLAVVALWLWLPSNPETLAEMVNERFNHYSLEVQKGTQFSRYGIQYVWIQGLNIQVVIDWMAMQQVGYYWALNSHFIDHESLVRQTLIFSAMRRYHMQHQQWPQRLEDLNIEEAEFVLNDPLNNKPFKYERIGEGFRFYSLGPNGIDDNGIFSREHDKDDRLIWPRDLQTDEPPQ